MARLLVLWLLSEHSMHGYQIKKTLTDSGQRFWFDLEDASIYSVLRTLVRQGHAVEAETEAAHTKRPRTRYAITTQGRQHYEQLLLTAVRSVPSFTQPVDVALASLGDMTSADFADSLAQREDGVAQRLAELERAARSAPAPALVDRHRRHLTAELDWVRSLRNTPDSER
jgi:DNA-binding PadR family transcriptional regulator